MALEYFRRHVSWRPALSLDQFVVRREESQAKVSYADIVLRSILDGADEYVVKLDVSMNNLLVLEEVKGEQYLFNDHSRVRL